MEALSIVHFSELSRFGASWNYVLHVRTVPSRSAQPTSSSSRPRYKACCLLIRLSRLTRVQAPLLVSSMQLHDCEYTTHIGWFFHSILCTGLCLRSSVQIRTPQLAINSPSSPHARTTLPTFYPERSIKLPVIRLHTSLRYTSLRYTDASPTYETLRLLFAGRHSSTWSTVGSTLNGIFSA